MDNFRRLTSDQLKERMQAGEAGLLVDLRDKIDFDQEHIAGSINIPLESLRPEEFLHEYSHRPIYLICASGKRAYNAAELFQQIGCSDIIVMAGGILSWRVLGYPLVGGKHRPIA